MKIILCGYMGSGKTTIGKVLSNLLAMDFVDLDELISTTQGSGISTIFKNKGEIYFRKSEKKVLRTLLSSPDAQVISLGGGTPCYGNNLELIKTADTFLVYLKMDVDALTNRLFEEKETRPVIAHYSEKKDLKDFIRKHLFERGYFYQQSDLIVEVGGKTAETVAKEIINKLD